MSWRSTTPPPPTTSPATATRQPAASPGRRFTDVATGGSVFGPTLHIRGSITGSDAVEIAGQVEGPIEVEGLLHVTEGARVTGPIAATDAVIEGELQGRLAARGRVELRATAKVRADVHAATVAIAEGCFFDGRIHMGGEGERGPTHFREKRRRRGRGAGNPDAQSAAAPDAAAVEPVPAAVAEPPTAGTGGDRPAAPEPLVAAPAEPAATSAEPPAAPAESGAPATAPATPGAAAAAPSTPANQPPPIV